MAPSRSALAFPLLACLAACPSKDLATETGETITSTSGASASSGSSSSTQSTPTTSDGPGSTLEPVTTTSASASTTGETGTSAGTDPVTATEAATSTTSTGDLSTTSTGSTGDLSTGSTGDTGAPAGCLINSDCETSACLEFRDHDPDAMCVAGPPGGNTRFPGTLLNFATGAPLPATDMKIIGLLSALGDPQNATPVVAGSSDALGIVDISSMKPVKEGIGVVAMVTGGPLFLTGTQVASPMAGVYGPMSDRHDIWGVPAATLTAWSALLMKDPALAANLPLGAQGGMLGLVRDNTGQPIAGAAVKSQNLNSTAQIRYLSADKNSFVTDKTAGSGIFVVLKAGLAERFEVVGSPEATGTSMSAKGAIFVLALDLP